MKIIFLDFDGVLNYAPTKPVTFVNGHPPFDAEPKALINQLVEETGAKIVVSSTWRLDGIDELRRVWQDNKMAGSILDVTPMFKRVGNYSLPRGCEIDYWLQETSFEAEPLESFCIIDDDPDMLLGQANNFVWVEDGFIRKGFEPKHYQQSLNILRGGQWQN